MSDPTTAPDLTPTPSAASDPSPAPSVPQEAPPTEGISVYPPSPNPPPVLPNTPYWWLTLPSPSLPRREVIDKLREGAEKLAERIAHHRREREAHTVKKAREYADALNHADHLEAHQRGFLALALALEARRCPVILAGISGPRAVEWLMDNNQYPDDWAYRKPYRQALLRAGITEDHYTLARSQLLGLVERLVPASAGYHRARIRRAELKLVGIKIPGYFPTPPDLARQVMWAASLAPDEPYLALEPSAGKGNLVEQFMVYAPAATVHVCELNYNLHEILLEKGFNVVGRDFLEYRPEARYDRVVMNPPFEQFADIEHVRHAWRLLRVGGRLAAILSASSVLVDGLGGPGPVRPRKKAAFNDWLREVGAEVEIIPRGAFNDPDRKTGVEARLVAVTKKEDYDIPSE